ncbi:MAG: septal ring lytic transglycosylase RlpA family protein [Saprospiraceae bacterium]|nr:septal ring lytic transglycosylase RlpA family protein [Saprospiraceae bacterium]
MRNLNVIILLVFFLSTHRIHAQEVGYACIYSESLCGGMVANGSRLNCDKLTAAHRSFKFGAQVRVTNMDNDKSVIVIINDRGPYNHKDIIDLTPAAAAKIGLTHGKGRVKVKIEKIIDD